MKKNLLAFLAISALAALSSCKTVDTIKRTDRPYEPPSDWTYKLGKDNDRSDGHIVWNRKGETKILKQPIVVKSGGTFNGMLPDGKLKQYGADPKLMGDGSQKEGQKPLFELYGNSHLKNVIIGGQGLSSADGVHVRLDKSEPGRAMHSGEKDAVARITNVQWRNVGEDAVTAKSGKGEVRIRKSDFAFASDKTIQLSNDFEGDVVAEDSQFFKVQKAMRSGNSNKRKQRMFLRRGSGRDIGIGMLAVGDKTEGEIKGWRAHNVKNLYQTRNGARVRK